jgi:hypothetical protein
MRTNSGQTHLVAALDGSIATAPATTAARCPHDSASTFDIASDGAIREIDAYVLGLHIHMRFSR